MRRRVAAALVGLALALVAARVSWTLQVREEAQLRDAARQQALRVWTDLRADLASLIELVDLLGRCSAGDGRDLALGLDAHPEAAALCRVDAHGAVVKSLRGDRGTCPAGTRAWQAAVASALRERDAAVSRPLRLADGACGFLVTRAGGGGAAVATIRFDDFVHACLDADLQRDCAVEIAMDGTRAYASGHVGCAPDSFEDHEMFRGHDWRVRVLPRTGARPLRRSQLPEVIVGAGVLAGALITALLAMLARLADESATVESVNRALHQVNADLEAQIGERRRLEQELERQLHEVERSNTELEQFACVASHDLQEPLRMVASYTQLLGARYRGQLDERADTYIEFAVDGARRMQQLIEDLLAYARAGTAAGAVEAVDLRAVFDECCARLAAPIRGSGALIERGELPVVTGRRAPLGQLIQNLLSNAIKFARPGCAPHVRVSATEDDEGWLLSVEDDGIGIEPQSRERIFHMFERLHPRSRYPGTGIGLALCRKIAQQHGGRIWAESSPGRGTTMHVLIPRPKRAG